MMRYALLIVMPEHWTEYMALTLGDRLAKDELPEGLEMVLTLPSPDGEAEGPKLKEWVTT
jgi:hypothetical protein